MAVIFDACLVPVHASRLAFRNAGQLGTAGMDVLISLQASQSAARAATIQERAEDIRLSECSDSPQGFSVAVSDAAEHQSLLPQS